MRGVSCRFWKARGSIWIGRWRACGPDGRHTNLAVLSDRRVEARIFPDWAMARVEATPDVARLLSADIDQDDRDAALDRLLTDLSLTAAGAV